MISLKLHNIIDYLMAAFLVACPFIFKFSDLDSARITFVALGLALLGYSLITNYPFSAAKVIPVGLHMTFDFTEGLILMLAPWAFAYRDNMSDGVFALHVGLGIGLCVFVAVTDASEKVRRGRKPVREETAHKKAA